MCECIDVEIGSYVNQVEMTNWWNGKTVCVDRCIANEIQELWDKRVQTTGCCCGHNKEIGFINVIDEHIPRMLELGYQYFINEFSVYCFFLKCDGNFKIIDCRNRE